MIRQVLNKYFFFIIVLCIGCMNVKSQSNEFNRIVNSLRRDTFYIDVPKTNRGNNGPEFLSARRLEKFYNLENIDKGYDSINIRIWLGYSRYSTELINIINKENVWKAIVNVYTSKKININDTSFIYEKSSEIRQPKAGWDTFTQELALLNFLKLPSDASISDYNKVTGESKRVLVEISTKYFYRIYSYIEPNTRINYIKEAAHLEKILDYIQEQLQFQLQEKI